MPTVLVTGSSGKTSAPLARLLYANKHDFLVASRSGAAPAPYADKGVKFDWTDESTYANPFDRASDISAVYIVAPQDGDPVKHVKDLIAFAMAKGVRRFVLLSASPVSAGGPVMGPVHAHLIDLAASHGIEWATLRPTWFMENFAEMYVRPIRDHDTIETATADGRVPFIAADDIAAVAYHALLDPKPLNSDPLILGPELLSYSDVAARIGSAVGRPVTHKKNTTAAQVDFFTGVVGLLPGTAGALAAMEAGIAAGAEDRTNDEVRRITGRAPRSFDDYVRENKNVWMRS